MPARPLLACCTALLCAVHADAQRLLIPHGSPSARIALVDATAGILIDGAFIDVAATATPVPANSGLTDVERVGDEVWVAAGRWVYRYDIATRGFLDSFDAGAIVRGLEAWRGRVYVARDGAVGVRSGSGSMLGELPIAGAHDVLHLEDDTLLVAHRSTFRIARYALDGSYLGEFAGPTIPTAFGILSHPEQLSPGRSPEGGATVLVSGDIRVYEFFPDGTFIREVDVGPFEAGVSETLSGRILVSLGTGLALYDPDTSLVSVVSGAFFGSGGKIGFFDRGLGTSVSTDDGRVAARSICRGALPLPGSPPARLSVLGSASPLDRALVVQLEGMTRGTPVIAAVARGAYLPAELVPGARCLDRASTVVLGQIAVADSGGTAFVSLFGDGASAPAILAGSTYYVQAAYRLEGQPFLSSALEIRMR